MTQPPELDWTEAERWRPIPGTEGRYEVSDAGRVRSWVREHGKRRTDPHVLTPSLSTKGYPRVKIGGTTAVEVHRLVMRSFAGPCPTGQEIRHLDGNPLNSSLGNLVYGTRSENAQDRVRHGTDWNASKTHCPQGHPYDDENTMRNRKGDRRCATCSREQKARWMREHYVLKGQAS